MLGFIMSLWLFLFGVFYLFSNIYYGIILIGSMILFWAISGIWNKAIKRPFLDDWYSFFRFIRGFAE